MHATGLISDYLQNTKTASGHVRIDYHDCTLTQYTMICIIMSFGYLIDFTIMQPSQITMVHYDEFTELSIL